MKKKRNTSFNRYIETETSVKQKEEKLSPKVVSKVRKKIERKGSKETS